MNGIAVALKLEYGENFVSNVMNKAWKNYEELVSENEDEPKAMWIHTRERIYPGIAVFNALMEEGIERDKAVFLLKNYYMKRSEKVAGVIRRIMKIPGLYRRIPKFFARMTPKQFGAAAGFQAEFYEQSKDVVRFDMLVCPYHCICQKYNCSEIVEMYCDADDVCYGNMHPKIQWLRTKTLGKGGDCCDFHVRISGNEK